MLVSDFWFRVKSFGVDLFSAAIPLFVSTFYWPRRRKIDRMWYIAGIPVVERIHGVVVSGFLFTTIATLCVSMRVFTRTVLIRNIGLDDYLMIVAVV